MAATLWPRAIWKISRTTRIAYRCLLVWKNEHPDPDQTPETGCRTLSILGANTQQSERDRCPHPCGYVLSVLTGVSGSGKEFLDQPDSPSISTQSISSAVITRWANQGNHRGWSHIDKVISIDQQAHRRTPRSNPCTYFKLFDPIRNLFAELPASSFGDTNRAGSPSNVKGGRCEACEGSGCAR
jgi:excinuclease ABC subunit A